MKVCQPVIEWGLKNKVTFRVLITLKLNTPGYMVWDVRHALAEDLGMSERTLRRHIDKLQKLGWVNLHNKTLYIRSWNAIYNISKFDTDHVKARFHISNEDLKSNKDTQVWLMAALVKRLGTYASKHRKDSQSRGVSDGSKFSPMAVSYLSKCFDISRGNIVRMKALAIESKAIKRQSDGILLKDSLDVFISQQRGKRVIYKKNIPIWDQFEGKMNFTSSFIEVLPDRLSVDYNYNLNHFKYKSNNYNINNVFKKVLSS